MSRLPELVCQPVGASEAVLESASLRKSICDAVLRECTEAFGDQLKAVISTGSLARDEASVVRQENSFVGCGDAVGLGHLVSDLQDFGAPADRKKYSATEYSMQNRFECCASRLFPASPRAHFYLRA